MFMVYELDRSRRIESFLRSLRYEVISLGGQEAVLGIEF